MQQPMVSMSRMGGTNMAAFGAAPQGGIAGMNPGNIPMQRGAGAQSHPHQVKTAALEVNVAWKKACDKCNI